MRQGVVSSVRSVSTRGSCRTLAFGLALRPADGEVGWAVLRCEWRWSVVVVIKGVVEGVAADLATEREPGLVVEAGVDSGVDPA